VEIVDSIEKSAAFARVNLGMTREEFDALTPSDFDLLVKEWQWKEYREDFRLALLRFTVAKASGMMRVDETPVEFSDFEPPRPDKKYKRRRKRTPSGRELLAKFQAATAGCETIDLRK